MLFVHLTDVRNVAHIKKHGLRTEGDEYWTGVYCMPLIQMEQERKGWTTTIRSTLLHWKFWIKEKRPDRSRPVAVIFKAPRHNWPAELTLEFAPDSGTIFSRGCAQRRISLIRPKSGGLMKRVDRDSVHLSVLGESHLKPLLREFERTGAKLMSGDIFQLMSYKPIPSRCIQRIIPLDQRNHTFKERRSVTRTRRTVQRDDD